MLCFLTNSDASSNPCPVGVLASIYFASLHWSLNYNVSIKPFILFSYFSHMYQNLANRLH